LQLWDAGVGLWFTFAIRPLRCRHFFAFPGIYIEKQKDIIAYYHIMLDDHDIVISEGIKTESLYLGPQALNSIPKSALKEAFCVLGLKKPQLKHYQI
jgi:hypothetical protein